ncbi:Hexose transport-related protein [Mycena chlorophos]|uniref:Hexose transport-related protein n=1 Tax=Mycena chlorophos TaxID=658473 RepID=A0A8H6TQS3_MYCCL|nr:Hexose transport-related protein [Mycena chlorophos]
MSSDNTSSTYNKSTGQYHSVKGTAVETIGNMTGLESWQKSGKEEHAAGEAEYKAAQAHEYVDGATDLGSLSAAVPLYNSEISPPELRGTVVSIQQFSIVTGICISFWFIVGKVVPDMLNVFKYGTYLFFLMFMLMGIAFAYWVLPETFGKSLEEMDLAFGSGEGQEDLARMERILVALETKDKEHPRKSDASETKGEV